MKKKKKSMQDFKQCPQEKMGGERKHINQFILSEPDLSSFSSQTFQVLSVNAG